VITIHAQEKNQSEVRDDLSISPSFCLPRSVSLCAARQQGEVETGSEAEVVDHDDAAAATPCNLSAELRYEAPLATFDGDEWTEFLLDAPPDNSHFRSPVDDVTSGGGSDSTKLLLDVPQDNRFRSVGDVAMSGDEHFRSTSDVTFG